MRATVRGWDPWRELAQLQNEVNRLFQQRWAPAARRVEYPPVNVWHNAESAVLMTELPGVNPDDLEIQVHGNTVTLRGRRAAAPLKDGETYLRRERYSAEFARTVELPFEVDPQRAEAVFDKGVLRLTLHRPEQHKPRKVTVRRG